MPHFYYPFSADGHLDCWNYLYFLAFVNRATVNMDEYLPLRRMNYHQPCQSVNSMKYNNDQYGHIMDLNKYYNSINHVLRKLSLQA